MIIYRVTNKINNKSYIGRTTRSLSARWYEHCYGTGCGIKLKNAINKYSKDNFIVDIMQTCSSIEELNSSEQHWIKHLDTIANGYNLSSGGKNSIPCAETRAKMSESNKIAQNRPERLIEISFNMKSLWQNNEYRIKQSKSRSGIPKSQEWKEQARARTKKIPIAQLDLNNNVIKIFDSAVDIKRTLGFSTSNIIANCKGRIKTAYGYMWKYSV